MKKLIIFVLVLLLVYLLTTGAGPRSKCPKGYARSPVDSTWAGWHFDCVPVGTESTLANIPSDTHVPPMSTTYAPIIARTGREVPGTPAKLNEFFLTKN